MQVTFTVTVASGQYRFSGDGFPTPQSNPTLHLVRGSTYHFAVNVSSSHPFYINTANSTGTEYAYNDGVSNNGTTSGTVVFTVPMNAPDHLHYNCRYHSTMHGDIYVVDAKRVDDLLGHTGSNFGTVFTGTTISDNATVKTALQELETKVDSNQSTIDNHGTVLGTSPDDTNLGTFTGTIISNDTTVKTALQELETTVESMQTTVESMHTTFTVTASSGQYLFSGDGFPTQQSNPTLHLVRGSTYHFAVNVSSSHPFYINTANSTGTEYAYNDGVSNNGTTSGTVVFTVPMNAPDHLHYNCRYHSTMHGDIYVVDAKRVDDLLGHTGSNFGTVFTGTTISDNATVKTALQELETKVDSNQSTIDNHGTVLGTSPDDTNLGTFTGTIISNDTTVKTALQDLETKVDAVSENTTGSVYTKKDACVDIMYRDTTDWSWYYGSGFIVKTPDASKESSFGHSVANITSNEGWNVEDMRYIVSCAHVGMIRNAQGEYASRYSFDVYATITNYKHSANATPVNITVRCLSIGADASGDIQVFLPVNTGYDSKIVNLKHHEYLEFGSSRTMSPGDPCFIIGNPQGIDSQSISSGIVRDPAMCNVSETNVETMFVTASSVGGVSGSPILDRDAAIIGMLTFGASSYETLGGGPAQFILEPVVKKIVANQALFPISYSSGTDNAHSPYEYPKASLNASLSTVSLFDVYHNNITAMQGIGANGTPGVPIGGHMVTSLTSGQPSPLEINDILLSITYNPREDDPNYADRDSNGKVTVSIGNIDTQRSVTSATWFMDYTNMDGVQFTVLNKNNDHMYNTNTTTRTAQKLMLQTSMSFAVDGLTDVSGQQSTTTNRNGKGCEVTIGSGTVTFNVAGEGYCVGDTITAGGQTFTLVLDMFTGNFGFLPETSDTYLTSVKKVQYTA